MEGIIVGDKTPEKIINKNENIKKLIISEAEKSPEEQVTSISNEISKEENTIISTKNSIDKIRQELGLAGEETNIPSIEVNKNKKSKLDKTLNIILSNTSSFSKVAAISAGLFAGGNNLEASNIGQNKNDKVVQGIENVSNIEGDKTKALNGGNIEEVVVYGKKKYEEELIKQEANIKKFESEMAKYQKDSIEWIKANKAYQDSLKLYDEGEGRYNFLKNLDIPFVQTPGMFDSADHGSKAYDEALKKAKVISEQGLYDLSVKSSIKPKEYVTTSLNYNIHSPNKKYVTNTSVDSKKYPSVPHLDKMGTDVWVNSNRYKKPTNEPIPPQKPENLENKEIKYDPKFEDLHMRSLWATILKQDPNAKIGTLHALDPQFEKGFTLEEAMAFSQEIKDKYNIDYIYNQIHGTEKAPNGDYKHPGWDYNNPEK